MMLPRSIYDRIPQIWILMGLMFFACGLYLGFEYKMIFAYLGMGVVSVLRGIWIYNARSEIQKQRHLENLRDLREARDAKLADEKAAAEKSTPTSESIAVAGQITPETESELIDDVSEAAANDAVLVAEPRKREPGEPVQYDPYDSLATRRHK